VIQQEESMNKQFNPGDPVFTLDGQLVTYIAKVSDGHCVRPVYEGDDGELYEDGSPMVVNQVFDTPPTERLEKEVAKLTERIEAKRQELSDLQTTIRVTTETTKDRIEAIKRHEGLARLDDFLAGRITHFVEKNYGPPVIKEFKKAMESEEEGQYSRVRPLRLLSLFGKTDGDLTWGINRYSDGSGDHSDVYPCCSLDEAKAKARELMEVEFKEAREKNRDLSYWDRWEAAAAAADMMIPVDIQAMNIQGVIRNAQTNLGRAESEAQTWRVRLTTASSNLAALNNSNQKEG
jgi:hypothetical protein